MCKLKSECTEYNVYEQTISGKSYIVKSVYLGKNTDIRTAILSLAERKAIRDMGLDSVIKQ